MCLVYSSVQRFLILSCLFLETPSAFESTLSPNICPIHIDLHGLPTAQTCLYGPAARRDPNMTCHVIARTSSMIDQSRLSPIHLHYLDLEAEDNH